MAMHPEYRKVARRPKVMRRAAKLRLALQRHWTGGDPMATLAAVKAAELDLISTVEDELYCEGRMALPAECSVPVEVEVAR